MYVREILARKGHDVKTIDPDQPLEVAAAMLRLERIGALVVTAADGKLAGILSEKDVVRAIADFGPRALNRPVGDFIETRTLTCRPGDTVAKTAKAMTLHRARHVPVTEDGEVRGIISIGDIVRERFEEMELERDALRDIALSHQLAG